MTTLLRGLLLAAVGWSLATVRVSARADNAGPDSRDRAAAVALNYCRASFHRIRKYQSKRVLIEEEEKILNNLDLTMIDDPEVIQLYSAVLDEINQIQIAEREKEFFKDQYRRTLQRQLGLSVFILAGQIATGQFVSALRTGVNSWWDYRDLGLRRDLDVWKVERQRINGVMNKSSQFLDTFWRVAKKRNIPDRWLVRGDDLDRLEQALQERDLAVRLRVLKRMEPFMECYPPYWYHVARTQQALGQLYAAADTYQRLADLAAGHFRKDDMLAAAMANLAMIQEYLEQPEAVETAREALRYSTDVWQANLMCAYILQRHGLVAEAEDAILRNLDVGMEESQSRLALLALYLKWDKLEKLAALLSDRETVEQTPVVFLLKSAEKLGGRLPETVREHLRSSLYGFADLHFGPDDFVLVATSNWQLQNARMTLVLGGQQFTAARGDWSGEQWRVRFPRVGEFGSDLRPQWERLTQATLLLHFPSTPTVRIELARPSAAQTAGRWSPFSVRTVTNTRPRHWLQVVRIELGDHSVTLSPVSPTPQPERAEPDDAAPPRPRAPQAPAGVPAASTDGGRAATAEAPASVSSANDAQTVGRSPAADRSRSTRPEGAAPATLSGTVQPWPSALERSQAVVPRPPATPAGVKPDAAAEPSVRSGSSAPAAPPTPAAPSAQTAPSVPASGSVRTDGAAPSAGSPRPVGPKLQPREDQPAGRSLGVPSVVPPPPDYPARWSEPQRAGAKSSSPEAARSVPARSPAAVVSDQRPRRVQRARPPERAEPETVEVYVEPGTPVPAVVVPPPGFVVPGPAAGLGRPLLPFGRPPVLAPPAPGSWD